MSQSTTTADVPADAATASLTDHPVFIALVAYLDAMRALTTFPSSPVPPALDEAVVAARLAFKEALGAGFFAAGSAQANAYDDAWLKQRFESLDEALKTRFEAIDESIVQLAAHEVEARAALAERLQKIEGHDLTAFAPTASLQGLEKRIEALEAGGVEVDFSGLTARVADLEQAAVASVAPATPSKR
ncbi:hypothetical protein [Brevundimonas faecalis]|uniref:Poly(3-hydroxyalkanoate) polymerase subunit PhaE n=1 Tax=Brevundimonas faecalis TaxID=947378 RepID=A0ABV2RAT3_9CAUL